MGCTIYLIYPQLTSQYLLDVQLPEENGKLIIAPYAIRKVEAALIRDGYKREEVVVAHPKKVEEFIDKNTTIVGVNTMDPYGLGPVTMMFTNGGKLTSYSKYRFTSLIKRLRDYRERRNYKFKIVVGGQACWQFQLREKLTDELKIDHIICGETDHIIGEIYRDIETGNKDRYIHITTRPSVEQIPNIVGASYKGMTEVMRGCGRGCRFCSPNLRTASFYPIGKIIEEVEVNIRNGQETAWLHSEDIFNYMVEDKKIFIQMKIKLSSYLKKFLKKLNTPIQHMVLRQEHLQHHEF